MSLTTQELALFRERVLHARRVLVFYDDDGDGLSSFLLVYRARGGDNPSDGRSTIGIRVHASAMVPADFAMRKIEENGGDLVLVLDKPYVEQTLLETCPLPILWLDHHEPQRTQIATARDTLYLNPRIGDDADNRCTTHWVWHALGREQDLWIAAIGSISDWCMTDIAESFRAQHPELLGDARDAPHALFAQPFGEIAALLQFNLKGDASDVRAAIKIFGRIESFDELLGRTSARSKFLWKRYEHFKQQYDVLLVAAKRAVTDDPVLFHIFRDVETSFTGELSNRLLHDYPDKIIFLGRDEGGDVKFSIRSVAVPVAPAVKQALALSAARGNAGGHANACGGKINSEDFPKFYEEFRRAMGFN
jgi:single-stranded DNA-specific DHH superfamily exonuclease